MGSARGHHHVFIPAARLEPDGAPAHSAAGGRDPLKNRAVVGSSSAQRVLRSIALYGTQARPASIPFGKLLGTKLKGLASTRDCGGSSRRHLPTVQQSGLRG